VLKNKTITKLIVDFVSPVDWSARCETPAGDSGRLETPQAKPRRLKHRPAESEHLERKSTGSLMVTTCFQGCQIKKEVIHHDPTFTICNNYSEEKRTVHRRAIT
jgi:hypothetical protein